MGGASRNMLSPSTPFTRHTASRIGMNKKDSTRTRMSVDSSFVDPTLSTGFRQRNATSFRLTKEPYPFFSPSFLIMEETVYDATKRTEQLVLAMVEENFTLNDIDCLPLGIALPLRDAIKSRKHSPSLNWPKDAYLLIGREDLANKGNKTQKKKKKKGKIFLEKKKKKKKKK